MVLFLTRDRKHTKNLLRLHHAFPIVGVDHKDNCMRFLVVFVPQRLQFELTAKIPKAQSYAERVDLANIQSDCGCDVFGIHALVVLGEFCLGRVEVCLEVINKIVEVCL